MNEKVTKKFRPGWTGLLGKRVACYATGTVELIREVLAR